MVTRAAVAKRLGVSIATVRRMEGNELHPWTDDRGVHQFDAAEIEQLAQADRETPWRAVDPVIESELRAARNRADQLEAELTEAQRALQTSAAQIVQLRSRAEEMRGTAIEALELVGVVLGGETPYEIHHLLRALQRQA